MKLFYKNKQSKNLILFLNGWGNDENALKHLTSSCDILILSDYNNLSVNFDFSKYEDIKLIAYSCGVFMSGYLADMLPEFSYKVAINGTLNASESKYRLSDEIIEAFTERGALHCFDFRRSLLVSSDREAAEFNKNSPKRSLNDCIAEFYKIKEYAQGEIKPVKFDKILISSDDKIIDTQLQKEYWKENYKIIENAGHFPFFKFKTYEEIIDY